MGRVGFGSERVKRAGLMGVLQGEIDPVEKLRRLVHGGTRVYGRQQAHLSIQRAKLDFPPLILGLVSILLSFPYPGRYAPFSSRKGSCPPHTGSLVPVRYYSKVIALTCQYKKFSPAPHGPLSAFIAAGQRMAL